MLGHTLHSHFVISAANLPADCINLGQGYMNFSPPQWVTDAADEALKTVAANHYSHPKGRIRLREAIKNYYGPLLGRNLNVDSEILVTSGANEGESMASRQRRATVNGLRSLRTVFCVYCFSRERGRSDHV